MPDETENTGTAPAQTPGDDQETNAAKGLAAAADGMADDDGAAGDGALAESGGSGAAAEKDRIDEQLAPATVQDSKAGGKKKLPHTALTPEETAALRQMVDEMRAGPVAAAYFAAVEIARSMEATPFPWDDDQEGRFAGDVHCWPHLSIEGADPIKCVIDVNSRLAPFLRTHGYHHPPEALYRQMRYFKVHEGDINGFAQLPTRLRLAWTVFQHVLEIGDNEMRKLRKEEEASEEAARRAEVRAKRRIDPDSDMLATSSGDATELSDTGKRVQQAEKAKPKRKGGSKGKRAAAKKPAAKN